MASAISHNDVPTLYAIAGAYAGFAHLQMVMEARANGPEDSARLRNEACTAYLQSNGLQRRTPTPVRFNSSDFPIPDVNAAMELSRNCGEMSAKGAP
jgi:hypothetical protein